MMVPKMETTGPSTASHRQGRLMGSCQPHPQRYHTSARPSCLPRPGRNRQSVAKFLEVALIIGRIRINHVRVVR